MSEGDQTPTPSLNESFLMAKGDVEPEVTRLAEYKVLRIKADNPGVLTLSGTNTWIVGSDPAWVVDPGPDLVEHVERIVSSVDERGGLGGIVLTHNHHDHTEAVGHLRSLRPAPLAAFRAPSGATEDNLDARLKDGDLFGPLEVVATPGHSSDHLALAFGKVCFTGDAVLGEGSVFISPEPGALAGYLEGLRRLRERKFAVLCPGHGVPVWDAEGKLTEYINHKLERESKLVAALAGGRRSIDDLLDFAWADVPRELRGVAAIVLAAHLDKLADEKRLPDGVERPQIDPAIALH